jgi:hypothetical protein
VVLSGIIHVEADLLDPISGQECMRGGIIELTAIITLDSFDGAAKLCGDISKKFW